MRRAALPLLLMAAFLFCGAERARRARADSPQACLNRLKRAVGRNNFTGEWAVLSPGFKKRMSERAGRTLDVGDYVVFRRAQLKDPDIRKVQRFMRTARMGKVRFNGKGYANASITFGGPLFFGRSIRVRMVQHKLWRLDVKGETQPYWGFVGDKTLTATKGKDGSYTLVTKDDKGKVAWQQTFAASEVGRYREFGKWFFDHFGKIETEFFGA